MGRKRERERERETERQRDREKRRLKEGTMARGGKSERWWWGVGGK